MRDKWTLLADFNVLVPGLGSLWPSLSCLSDHCLTHVRGEKAAFQSRLFVGKHRRRKEMRPFTWLFFSSFLVNVLFAIAHLFICCRQTDPSQHVPTDSWPWTRESKHHPVSMGCKRTRSKRARERETFSSSSPSSCVAPRLYRDRKPLETTSLPSFRFVFLSSSFPALMVASDNNRGRSKDKGWARNGQGWERSCWRCYKSRKPCVMVWGTNKCRHFFRMTRDLRLFNADRTRFGNCILAVPAMRMKYW